MRIEFAQERLLSGEVMDRVSLSGKSYGYTLSARVFGRRVILDIITGRAS